MNNNIVVGVVVVVGGGGLSQIHTHINQEIHDYGIKDHYRLSCNILNQLFFSVSLNTGLSHYSPPLQ